jgi:type 2 lantibiotic biosynthesis protein LanM
MDSSSFHSAEWYSAATLAERLAAPRAASEGLSGVHEAARAALDWWQSQPPFDQDSLFARRLERDAISEDDLLALLNETPEDIQARLGAPPSWLEMLAEAFSRQEYVAGDPLPLPERLRGAQSAGFLSVVAPILRLALSRVRREAERIRDQHGSVPFDPATVAVTLFSGLPMQLHSMLSRPLVLELNIARMQGRLPGETPQERFAAFLQWLEQPANVLTILREYPVLARRVTNRIRKWIARSTELLERLADDYRDLQAIGLLPNDCGLVAEIGMGAGDTHRDGRSVAILRFTSGAKIVYKPRALDVDRHFQELLRWLNERMSHAEFRTIGVLTRSDYGWVEFVEPASCASSVEVSRFYRRQGGYLALLYALGANDFHFENLIAAGEHPVLIDLESLFHPPAKFGAIDSPDLRLANDAMLHSVLRVGLLPRRSWSDDEYEGADLSGLGGKPGQLSPDRVLRWAEAGTDEMRAERRRVEMGGSHNRPALHDKDDQKEIDPLDYLEALLEGFSALYRVLLERRAELLSEEGPLARFGDDSIRAIIRPTRFYGLLLNESSHPDMGRDGLELEQFLDRLWVNVDEAPFLADVIPSERRDLLNDDVPIFTTTPRSTDIWDSAGERIAGFLERSGWDSVKQIVAGMSEEDLGAQLWFIRASMATLVMESEEFRWPRFSVRRETLRSRDELRERALEQAKATGDRLLQLALRSDDHLTWIGLTFSDMQWSLLPLREDLYSGSPGVILTLAYLGQISGEARYTEAARCALETLKPGVDQTAAQRKTIGAFHGWGSLIYTFTHLGALWNDPALFAAAEEFVEQLAPLIDDDAELDIIGGTAGCLGALLSLQKVRPSSKTLDAAIRCGEHLLQTATVMNEGLGWPTKVGSGTPIAGFSHGCSGMAWALGELWGVTGDERYKTTAMEAVRYERSQFVPAAGNWPRPESAPAEKEDRMALSVAWCYGAPGIGLARLRLLRNIDHPLLREDLSAAVKTTLEQGFGTNHSLCHGALGNLDFLIQADEALNDATLHDEVTHLEGAILDSMASDGWLCGVPLGVESPSLLNGLAGIGYGLLRLAEPARVPSVLAIDPPTRA